MNKKNTEELERAYDLIDKAQRIIDRVVENEEDRFNYYLEESQKSKKGLQSENNTTILGEIVKSIEECRVSINKVIGRNT